MTHQLIPRPFWNDGGPLIIVPQAAIESWEGSDAPSGRRKVDAVFRWRDPDAPACDYDRACDVDPENAGALDIGGSWGIVIGTAAAQSAQWLPGSEPREFYAVGIEAADDTAPDRLRVLASTSAQWRILRERVAIGPEGLLLTHAASRLPEVRELPAMMAATDGKIVAALIGDGLRHVVPSGEYSVSTRDVSTSGGEYLTFIRFTRASAA